MKKFLSILSIIIILIGSLINFIGLGNADSYSSYTNSTSLVISGGIFIFLGVSILFLIKDK